MTTTLVLPDSIANELRRFAALPIETGGVLLARLVRPPNGDIRLIATGFLPVPEDAYERRTHDSLRIASHGYVPALGQAEIEQAVPIWLHTHPGDRSSARPSTHDETVDAQLSDLFRLRANSEYYGSVIFSHRAGTLSFTGRVESSHGRREIDRCLTVGDRVTLVWSDRADTPPLHTLFDRHIRAFGGDVQRALGDLRVAVVGCGGTGSAVIEQLVRLGVRHLTLVDPDTISESNVTRVYGSRRADVGRPKVDVAADNIAAIAPEIIVERIASKVTMEATVRKLSSVDVVFGCTDDNSGRLVLSRFATFMMTPVIDCGVILSSDSAGHLAGIDGRVTVLSPGTACLVCRNRIDMARAQAEALTQEELRRRVGEGYAPALPGVEPAVVTYTTAVAACAVSELLERLIGYGPEPVPSEIILRLHERELSTNLQSPRPGHYCDPSAKKLGLGDTEPYLEQTWVS